MSDANNIIFSDGNPKAKIMIIGEGPGSNEDQEGIPFVGRAGALLDKMLDAQDISQFCLVNLKSKNKDLLQLLFPLQTPLK